MTIPLSEVDEIVEKFDALDVLMPIRAIHSAADHERAVRVLGALLDSGGADQHHAFSLIVETIGILVEAHESQVMSLPVPSGVGALGLLMDQNGLRQGDLAEIGTRALSRSGATANAS